MIRIVCLALLAVLAAAPAAAQSAGVPLPRLKSEATVTGDLVRIGDLLDHAGPAASIPIFRAPDLGETGAVPASRVLDALALHGLLEIDMRGIPEVVVRRASRTIAVKDVEASIARALAVRFGLGDARNVSITFDREVRAIQLEPSVTGALQPGRISYDPRSGRFDATFEIAGNAPQRITLRYTGAAIETLDAVVAVHPIARADVLKASDIVIERRPKAEVGADTVREAANAIGLAARRSLRPGQSLRAADLMKPEIVLRNEPVTLIYQVPGVVLTARGKAVESGSDGDVVSVLNTHSKRTVQGTIVGPARVLVGATMPRLASSTTPPPPAGGASRRRTE